MPINLIAYFGLAYALSWAWWLPLAFTHTMVDVGSLPTHMPGLLGPAIAALVAARFIDGGAAFRDLIGRIVNVRLSPWGWIATLSPVGLLAISLAADAVTTGRWPNLSGFGDYPGVPRLGAALVLLIVFLVNGFGEEIGWRGYALPRLQSRYGARIGTLVLFPLWALWHAPLFWFLTTFMQMNPIMIVFAWGLGLLAGTLVLANVTHLARGSVFAAAFWHAAYNVTSATGASYLTQALTTTAVMIWAVALIWRAFVKPRDTLLDVPPPPKAKAAG